MWVTLQIDSLKTALTGGEYTALAAAALAEGQANPLPAIIRRAVQLVRGKVAAGGHTLEEGETIPQELEDAALCIVRFNALTRFPNLRALLDANRVAAKDDALKLLREVASGTMKIEAAETPTEQVVSAPGPNFTATTPTRTRANQSGL